MRNLADAARDDSCAGFGFSRSNFRDYKALWEQLEDFADRLDDYKNTTVALTATCKYLCNDIDFPRDPLTNVYKMAFCETCGHALPADTPADTLYKVELSGLPGFAQDSFTDDHYGKVR